MRTIRTIATLSVVALASPSIAIADTIDLSGLESWGYEGDPDNDSRVYQLADPGPIDGFGYIILQIDYDITIQTFGTSKFSDLNIRFGNSDGTFHGSWPDTFQPGASGFGTGTARFTGSFATDIHLNEDGQFHIELFDSFDDIPMGADAVLLPGSTMTLGQFIPAPGAVPALALSALAISRRRR